MWSAVKELIGINKRIRWQVSGVQREIRVILNHRVTGNYLLSNPVVPSHLWASIRCWRDNWTFARWSVLTEIAVVVWSVSHKLMDLNIWSLDGGGMLGKTMAPTGGGPLLQKKGYSWWRALRMFILLSLSVQSASWMWIYCDLGAAVSMALPSLQWPTWLS